LLLKRTRRVDREHGTRKFSFFESENAVIICSGIGVEAARRAAEAAIALYKPDLVQSVGFAGSLDPKLRVGDVFVPATVIDARDGSRTEIQDGNGTLLTFMSVADATQKRRLGEAYISQAIDMEAAAVAAAAQHHGIRFRAVKVISDELGFEIPDLSRFVDSEGRFRTASFIIYAAVRPWLWMRIASLADASRKAGAALQKHLIEHSTMSVPAAKIL